MGEIAEETGGNAVALPSMAIELSEKICDSFMAANSTSDHHER
jgi:hypothetical protein